MCSSRFLMLLATLAALALLVLVIFSEPFIHQFYFLRTTAAGGVRFGALGFCVETTGVCVKKPFNYTFQPELLEPFPMVLVLYPVAAGFALLGAIFLVPIIFSRRRHHHHHHHSARPRWAYVLFGIVSFFAFLAAAAALGITLWLFINAMRSFQAEGFEAALGPSVWIAIAAAGLLLVVALNAGCGTCAGGRFGRQPRDVPYTY